MAQTITDKIKNLTWFNLVEKLKEILSAFGSGKQVIKIGDYTLKPEDNDAVVSMDGGICTIDPAVKYQDGYLVGQKNITEATDGTIECVAKQGWSYKLNKEATVASATYTFPAGEICTITKFEGENKIYIDGGVE